MSGPFLVGSKAGLPAIEGEAKAVARSRQVCMYLAVEALLILQGLYREEGNLCTRGARPAVRPVGNALCFPTPCTSQRLPHTD